MVSRFCCRSACSADFFVLEDRVEAECSRLRRRVRACSMFYGESWISRSLITARCAGTYGADAGALVRRLPELWRRLKKDIVLQS